MMHSCNAFDAVHTLYRSSRTISLHAFSLPKCVCKQTGNSVIHNSAMQSKRFIFTYRHSAIEMFVYISVFHSLGLHVEDNR